MLQLGDWAFAALEVSLASTYYMRTKQQEVSTGEKNRIAAKMQKTKAEAQFAATLFNTVALINERCAMPCAGRLCRVSDANASGIRSTRMICSKRTTFSRTRNVPARP